MFGIFDLFKKEKIPYEIKIFKSNDFNIIFHTKIKANILIKAIERLNKKYNYNIPTDVLEIVSENEAILSLFSSRIKNWIYQVQENVREKIKNFVILQYKLKKVVLKREGDFYNCDFEVVGICSK
ncbi:MAG: hypothetical protein QW156_04490 [Candidatus Aenigmatarchaeota archaeon]